MREYGSRSTVRTRIDESDCVAGGGNFSAAIQSVIYASDEEVVKENRRKERWAGKPIYVSETYICTVGTVYCIPTKTK